MFKTGGMPMPPVRLLTKVELTLDVMLGPVPSIWPR
ncbi:hypothetical protein H4S14_003586 [Agrobacterium vitis]|nr:hypothetical protein [Agrobacterium vitis]MBE1439821.1 hypothetical protein [Agrobacterium vitis]